MREQLLQFIWQHQYLNARELQTYQGEPLHILFPGTLNRHQGPDFLDAGIRIGNTLWAGHIELHINVSDWDRHAHQQDKHYRNVILHVVWEEPGPDEKAALHIPLLILQRYVPKLLLHQYEEWMQQTGFVACERQLLSAKAMAGGGNATEGGGQAIVREGKIVMGERPSIMGEDWKKKLLIQRLQQRCKHIISLLKETHQHWEEVTWRRLARNFGLPVNAEAFEAMATSIPFPVVARYARQPLELEALLMGQAGLLEGPFQEEYPRTLSALWQRLRSRHQLSPTHEPVLFMRMRPDNFPTIRLAQLAMLLTHSVRWFAQMREAVSPAALREELSVKTSLYWKDHYTWEKRSVEKDKQLGEAMIDSILINTFIPLLYTYGWVRNDKAFRDRALSWLEAIRPEKNTQVAGWAHLGIQSRTAADSQALLELKKKYCDTKGCLQCAIGKALLTSN